MTERTLRHAVQLAASRLGARLFRNNTGVAWQGKQIGTRDVDGSVVLHDARRITMGLTVGSSDLIGWTPVTITADMVGKELAVFTALELKTGKQKATREQANFLQRVKWSGGIAGVVHSVEEVAAILER